MAFRSRVTNSNRAIDRRTDRVQNVMWPLLGRLHDNPAMYGHEGLAEMTEQNARSPCCFPPRLTTDRPIPRGTRHHWRRPYSFVYGTYRRAVGKILAHAQHVCVFSRQNSTINEIYTRPNKVRMLLCPTNTVITHFHS